MTQNGERTGNHDWSNNQYFLSGKLEALDVAGEWFLQQSDNRLFFFPPQTAAAAGTCAPPLPGTMEYKARDFVITQVQSTISLS